MPGLDSFIATELSAEIKKKLDKKILRKFERKLFTKRGTSIKQSIENFEEIDNILKEYLGPTQHNFKSHIIKRIFVAKKTKDKNNFLITITNSKLADFLIKCCGDSEIRKILTTQFNKPLTISEILNVTKIPKTTGYRKISLLIRNGLLVKRDTVKSSSKRVEKFTKLFKLLTITIKDGKNEVSAMIPQKIYNESSVIKSQMVFDQKN